MILLSSLLFVYSLPSGDHRLIAASMDILKFGQRLHVSLDFSLKPLAIT